MQYINATGTQTQHHRGRMEKSFHPRMAVCHPLPRSVWDLPLLRPLIDTRWTRDRRGRGDCRITKGGSEVVKH